MFANLGDVSSVGVLAVWLVGVVISLWITWLIIRSAVLSALRAHAKEQHPHQIELMRVQQQLQQGPQYPGR